MEPPNYRLWGGQPHCRDWLPAWKKRKTLQTTLLAMFPMCELLFYTCTIGSFNWYSFDMLDKIDLFVMMNRTMRVTVCRITCLKFNVQRVNGGKVWVSRMALGCKMNFKLWDFYWDVNSSVTWSHVLLMSSHLSYQLFYYRPSREFEDMRIVQKKVVSS